MLYFVALYVKVRNPAEGEKVSFRPIVYSGQTRQAASVAAVVHGDRIWTVDEKCFGTVPTIMMANLVRSGTSEDAWTLALLFGACDQRSTYDYERMLAEFGEDMVRWHRAASWTDIMAQRNGQVTEWGEAAASLRGHLRGAPPVSRLVWLAYEHYRITALAAMAEEHQDLAIWQRFFQGFPGPHNQYPALQHPYGFMVQYYRQLFRLHNEDARDGRVLLNEVHTISQAMEHSFARAGLT